MFVFIKIFIILAIIMKFNPKYLNFILILFLANSSISQTIHQLGGKIRTNGWGVLYNYSPYEGNFNAYSLSAEIVNHKSNYETKVFNPAVNAGGNYVYGKLNQVWLTRFRVNKTINLFEPKGKINVSLNPGLGVQLNFVKPVYYNYEVYGSDGPKVFEVKFDPENPLESRNIIGNARFERGLNETDIYLGMHTQLALHLSWSGMYNNDRIIGFGIDLDRNFADYQIMAHRDNNVWQSQFFVTFLFGWQ